MRRHCSALRPGGWRPGHAENHEVLSLGFERPHVGPVAAAAKVALEENADGSVEVVRTGEAAMLLQVLRAILPVALHGGLVPDATKAAVEDSADGRVQAREAAVLLQVLRDILPVALHGGLDTSETLI